MADDYKSHLMGSLGKMLRDAESRPNAATDKDIQKIVRTLELMTDNPEAIRLDGNGKVDRDHFAQAMGALIDRDSLLKSGRKSTLKTMNGYLDSAEGWAQAIRGLDSNVARLPGGTDLADATRDLRDAAAAITSPAVSDVERKLRETLQSSIELQDKWIKDYNLGPDYLRVYEEAKEKLLALRSSMGDRPLRPDEISAATKILGDVTFQQENDLQLLRSGATPNPTEQTKGGSAMGDETPKTDTKPSLIERGKELVKDGVETVNDGAHALKDKLEKVDLNKDGQSDAEQIGEAVGDGAKAATGFMGKNKFALIALVVGGLLGSTMFGMVGTIAMALLAATVGGMLGDKEGGFVYDKLSPMFSHEPKSKSGNANEQNTEVDTQRGTNEPTNEVGSKKFNDALAMANDPRFNPSSDFKGVPWKSPDANRGRTTP